MSLMDRKKNESKIRLKCGKPIRSIDTNTRKRKIKEIQKENLAILKNTHIEQDVAVEAHNEQKTLEEVQTKQIAPEYLEFVKT